MADTHTALNWLRDGKSITKEGWGSDAWIKLQRDGRFEQIVDERGVSFSLSQILGANFLSEWSIWTDEAEKSIEYLDIIRTQGYMGLSTQRICDILEYLLNQAKKKG